MEQELPTITMEKLLKDAGAHRVSESAKEELRRVLEQEAIDVAKQAIVLAKHAGRKTVKKEDIQLALD